MSPPALVIFDCDGVLVDSEGISNRIFRDMLEALGLQLTLADMFERFVGLSMPQCVELVTRMRGSPPPDDFVSILQARTEAALRAEVQAMPGVVEVLDRLTVPYCVASSGSHTKIRTSLQAVGLLDRFGDNIFSVADVGAPKPAPDVFLHAAERMGAEPLHCAVIEDTPTGVRAGIAAGMQVLGYCTWTPAERLRQAGAHRVFADMRLLPKLLPQLEWHVDRT
jgi:HAD superfamily hydrolase (TIGR01509 family)